MDSKPEEIAKMWETEMRKGYAKLVILTILNKETLTGYDIIKKMEQKTLGCWSITAGGVYPVLKELEEKKYITGKWNTESKRKKKNYEITNEGKQLLEVALQRQQQISETINNLFHEFAQDILNTNLPQNSKPRTSFLFWKNLEEKTISEQILIIKRERIRLQQMIKYMNKRLSKLEKSKYIK